MASITTFLQSIKFPVMPEVAHALISTLKDDNAGVPEVRNLIAKDPALTATLLRMANSALFGLSRQVHTLDAAIAVVGMGQIRARALSICMAHSFDMPTSLNRLDFWRSSMVCAGYARWLAMAIHIDENEAWLTGMMLRLGELVIAQHNPGMIASIERRPCPPGERWERERQVAKFDEAAIMAEIAHRWDFTETVVEGFAAASQPMEARLFSKLGAVVHLAALLADQSPFTPDVLQLLPADVVQRLQLDIVALQPSLPVPETFADISMMPT
ncbi:HDOD domain-containing protein [Rhodoferax aquaticus]|uniref:HDOD domain-containing protein n=1 Tax=Rhodoferax aquaticus TaxID=2527691 RepID=A0A515ENC8_9BURK|nr:HDOD domain-containing protein [Rhodoferax aquaticus]QDL54134.1 HDOD domain-containing protein [Rhodoferax aquaticus]